MYYCEPCRVKCGWPESLLCSRGRCEVCAAVAVCHDTPSSRLPLPPPAPGPRMTVDGDLVLTTGRVVEVYGGKIAPVFNDGGYLAYGYRNLYSGVVAGTLRDDPTLAEGDEPALNPAELGELCDWMIARWARFKRERGAG